MTVTISAPGVRVLDTQATGYTGLLVNYLKRDPSIVKLRFELLDDNGVVQGYDEHYVYSFAVGVWGMCSVDIPNNLQAVSLTPVSHITVSVPKASSVTYTAPVDQYAVLNPSNVGVRTENNIRISFRPMIVFPGVKVFLDNATTVDVTQDVYLFNKSDIDAVAKTFTLRISEIAGDGSVVYQYTITITEIPPIIISG